MSASAASTQPPRDPSQPLLGAPTARRRSPVVLVAVGFALGALLAGSTVGVIWAVTNSSGSSNSTVTTPQPSGPTTPSAAPTSTAEPPTAAPTPSLPPPTSPAPSTPSPTPPANCTVDGRWGNATAGTACVFPFRMWEGFREIWGCTVDYMDPSRTNGSAWCATRPVLNETLDSANLTERYWGTCSAACPTEPPQPGPSYPETSPWPETTQPPPRPPCMTTNATGGAGVQACAFPFTRGGFTYRTCLKDDPARGAAFGWCSVKPEFTGAPEDWGGCTPGCPQPVEPTPPAPTPRPQTPAPTPSYTLPPPRANSVFHGEFTLHNRALDMNTDLYDDWVYALTAEVVGAEGIRSGGRQCEWEFSVRETVVTAAAARPPSVKFTIASAGVRFSFAFDSEMQAHITLSEWVGEQSDALGCMRYAMKHNCSGLVYGTADGTVEGYASILVDDDGAMRLNEQATRDSVRVAAAVAVHAPDCSSDTYRRLVDQSLSEGFFVAIRDAFVAHAAPVLQAELQVLQNTSRVVLMEPDKIVVDYRLARAVFVPETAMTLGFALNVTARPQDGSPPRKFVVDGEEPRFPEWPDFETLYSGIRVSQEVPNALSWALHQLNGTSFVNYTSVLDADVRGNVSLDWPRVRSRPHTLNLRAPWGEADVKCGSPNFTEPMFNFEFANLSVSAGAWTEHEPLHARAAGSEEDETPAPTPDVTPQPWPTSSPAPSTPAPRPDFVSWVYFRLDDLHIDDLHIDLKFPRMQMPTRVLKSLLKALADKGIPKANEWLLENPLQVPEAVQRQCPLPDLTIADGYVEILSSWRPPTPAPTTPPPPPTTAAPTTPPPPPPTTTTTTEAPTTAAPDESRTELLAAELKRRLLAQLPIIESTAEDDKRPSAGAAFRNSSTTFSVPYTFGAGADAFANHGQKCPRPADSSIRMQLGEDAVQHIVNELVRAISIAARSIHIGQELSVDLGLVNARVRNLRVPRFELKVNTLFPGHIRIEIAQCKVKVDFDWSFRFKHLLSWIWGSGSGWMESDIFRGGERGHGRTFFIFHVRITDEGWPLLTLENLQVPLQKAPNVQFRRSLWSFVLNALSFIARSFYNLFRPLLQDSIDQLLKSMFNEIQLKYPTEADIDPFGLFKVYYPMSGVGYPRQTVPADTPSQWFRADFAAEVRRKRDPNDCFYDERAVLPEPYGVSNIDLSVDQFFLNSLSYAMWRENLFRYVLFTRAMLPTVLYTDSAAMRLLPAVNQTFGPGRDMSLIINVNKVPLVKMASDGSPDGVAQWIVPAEWAFYVGFAPAFKLQVDISIGLALHVRNANLTLQLRSAATHVGVAVTESHVGDIRNQTAFLTSIVNLAIPVIVDFVVNPALATIRIPLVGSGPMQFDFVRMQFYERFFRLSLRFAPKALFEGFGLQAVRDLEAAGGLAAAIEEAKLDAALEMQKDPSLHGASVDWSQVELYAVDATDPTAVEEDLQRVQALPWGG